MHIGEKIKAVYESRNIKLTDFAQQIGTVRQNVYRMFERDTVDTDMLRKISEVLAHDFFQYYRLPGEPETTPTVFLQHDVNQLQEELTDAQKELEYQKHIVALREEEMRLLESKLKTQKEISDAIIANLKAKEKSYQARIKELEAKLGKGA